MKKLLLLGCALLGIGSASAAFNDFFTVTYEGEPVEDGQTIICNTLLDGLDFEDNYSADVEFMSLEGDQLLLISVNPDIEDPAYDGDAWGLPQVCEGGNEGNCYSGQEYYFAEISDSTPYIWMIEATGVELGANPVYIVNAMVAYGDQEDYEIDPESVMTFKIKYDKNDAAVEGIAADSNEAPVYYNLLGKRVNNPSNGVFIVKQGKKVTKQLFR